MLYDIFISYSHNDNVEDKDAELAAWADQFYFELNRCLTELLGRPPKIFYDTSDMRANFNLASAIHNGIDNSRVLLPIFSPSYTTSKWCPLELERFCARKQETSGSETKIFPALKIPVRADKIPPQLAGAFFRYQFFEKDKLNRMIFFKPWSDTHPEFSKLIEGFAYELSEFLLKFEEESEIPAPVRVQPQMNGGGNGKKSLTPVIYLAEPSSDLWDDYKNIEDDLTGRKIHGQFKFDFKPEKRDQNDSKPISNTQYKDSVSEAIEDCNITVELISKAQLLSDQLSTEKMYLQLQNEVLAKRGNDLGLKRLVWIKDNSSEEGRDKKLLDTVRNAASDRIIVCDNPEIENFKKLIEDEIRPKVEIKVPPGKNIFDKPPLQQRKVYVISDEYFEEDITTVGKLEKQLIDTGLKIYSTRYIYRDTKNKTEIHRRYLCECDAVLIYFYNCLPYWVIDRLDELDKSPGYGRENPFRAKGVFYYGDLEHQKEIDFPDDILKVEGYPQLPKFITELSLDAEVQAQ